jgi:hypothetical protein
LTESWFKSYFSQITYDSNEFMLQTGLLKKKNTWNNFFEEEKLVQVRINKLQVENLINTKSLFNFVTTFWFKSKVIINQTYL